jgi:serine/threonine-protein kinase
MAGSDDQRSKVAAPPDLLPLIRQSGVLNERQFEEVRTKVSGGEYPRDSIALAHRLVADQILTDFQAARLLQNKSHGFVVGGYVVLDRLGQGSKGRVFKAQHRLMGRLVALKVIAPQIASRASSIARFYREMRLLGRLDHPNVVRAFDAEQAGDLLYLVMEYVPGRDLERVLEDRGVLCANDVGSYMAQAALGLAHAHDRGIVHRDVKPTNLILSEEGQVKVLDLGLGALMEADSETSFATAAGRSVGTLNYMSPEQASASDVDGRSDLFSLGCTMYHLLTGQVPFPGATVVECLKRRAEGNPVPIADLRPDLPLQMVEVLDKLMAPRPENRFQTGSEAAEALQALLQPGQTNLRPEGPRAQNARINEIASAPGSNSTLATPPTPPLSPSSDSSGVPDPDPSRLSSLLAVWPSLGSPLVIVILGVVIFLVGFALGQASAIMLLRGGSGTQSLREDLPSGTPRVLSSTPTGPLWARSVVGPHRGSAGFGCACGAPGAGVSPVVPPPGETPSISMASNGSRVVSALAAGKSSLNGNVSGNFAPFCCRTRS